MRGSAEVVKGRIEEAAGVLTDDASLRAKGQADQTAGHMRQDAEKGVKKAKVFARKLVDRAKNVAHEAVEKAQKSVD